MDKIWLARKYLSSSSSSSSNSRATTSIIYATALSASANGTVTIEVDDTELTVPCVCSVNEGQRVIVSLLSGSPVVIGVVGWGDQVETDITSVVNEIAELTSAVSELKEALEKLESALSDVASAPASTVPYTIKYDWTSGSTTGLSDLSLTSGELTVVPWNNANAISADDGSYFTLRSDGGITCLKDGLIQIISSLYFSGGTDETIYGNYIYKDEPPTSGVQLAGNYGYSTGNGIQASAFVPVSSNTPIYHVARATGGSGVSVIRNNQASWLEIAYLAVFE